MFRQSIIDAVKKLDQEENYTEAVNYVSNVFRPACFVPEEVQVIIDASYSNPNKDSFELFASAIGDFIREHKRTPVSYVKVYNRGNIPDFHSDTKSYVKIKNVYNS